MRQRVQLERSRVDIDLYKIGAECCFCGWRYMVLMSKFKNRLPF